MIELRIYDKRRQNYLHKLDGFYDITFCDSLWYFAGGDLVDNNYVIEISTGVHDLNGLMIFEGDIIQNHNVDEKYASPAVIVQSIYDTVGWSTAYKAKHIEPFQISLIGHKFADMQLIQEFPLLLKGKYTVVGNIHQNKDLL